MVYVKSVKKMIIVSLLSLCIMTNTVYSDVQAASVVIGGVVLTAGEAFALLMATLGVSATTAVAYQNRDTLQAWGNEQLDLFCSWMAETDEIVWSAQQDVEQWALNVIDGGLSTSGDMWKKFKKWISSIYTKNNDSPVIEENAFYIDALSNYFGVPVYCGLPPDEMFPYKRYFNDNILKRKNQIVCVEEKVSGYDYPVVTDCYAVATDAITIVKNQYGKQMKANISKWCNATNSGDFFSSYATGVYPSNYFSVYITSGLWETLMNSYSDLGDFESGRYPEKESSYALNLAVAHALETADSPDDVELIGIGSQAGAQACPLNLPSAEALPDSLAGLSTGALSLEDFNKALGLALANLSNSTLITEDPDNEKPISDVTTEIPVDMKHFIVDGLAELFPFCLPFDFIDFVNVLCAEPQAPKIEFPIKYPAGISSWGTYMIEVDLSVFDSVAEIMRDLECLLFIVGLIVITRSYMIRG